MEALLISTGIVALAEIGDKTQLLAFILAARFKKPLPIILGILCATVVNHGLAGALGAWITTTLSGDTLRWVLGASFIGMAIWTLIPDKIEEEETQVAKHLGVFGATLITFFLAEMGDKTQIATVAMAAKFPDPILVVIGTTLGMLIADVPAVFVGDRFAAKIPMKLVHSIAAAIFAILGIATLLGAGKAWGSNMFRGGAVAAVWRPPCAWGCTTVVMETARKVYEDRSTDQQWTDVQIASSVLGTLSDKDKGLLLDVSADVWELRVMLTGTVVDSRTRQDLVQRVRADRRILKVYDEIQVVHRKSRAPARGQQQSSGQARRGRARGGRCVDRDQNFAQLITTGGVTSVNYRWRSVRGTVYLIGRAQTRQELATVLGIVRATDGVLQVRQFIEVRPNAKS